MFDSSVVWNLHLSTPTSVLSGKGLAGFLSPIWLLVLSSSLSMLGCVWSWMALLGVLCSCILILARASSEMRRDSMPVTSIVSRPPSRFATTTIFSSSLACTLEKQNKVVNS